MYLTLKALHIIAFTAWMAGMFYLPRLYVYHAEALAEGNASQDRLDMLQTMERKLLRYIMNPAMIITFLLGFWLLFTTNTLSQGWIHAKLLLVFAMAGMHGWCAVERKNLAGGQARTSKFYRVINEVPTLLLIGIVVLAVVKPF